MNIEAVIAFLIVFAAIAYVVYIAFRKMTAFNRNSTCAGDCGCDSATKKVH